MDGGVPRQVLHLVAQEVENIQAHAIVLDEAVVTNQIFQSVDEHQLEKDYRVKQGLADMAAKGLYLCAEKVPVEELGEVAAEILRRHPLRQLKT